MPTQSTRFSQGYVLITSLMALILLMLLVTVYLTTSLTAPRTAKANADSLSGFMAAEGGLNMRAAVIREKFIGFERPAGVSPTDPKTACTSATTQGSGDFACQIYTLGGKQVKSYVTETTKDPNGDSGTVSAGELYAGLNFLQYAYKLNSVATSGADRQADVSMQFQSRLVPLFQFAAFYTADLEINPGAAMTLNGRVHTNGSLYMSPSTSLSITGKVSAGQGIYRIRKDNSVCNGGPVQFSVGTPLGCTSTAELDNTQLAAYQGYVLSHQPQLTVPSLTTLDPDPTGTLKNELWSKADVRVVATPCALTFCLSVQTANGITDTIASAALTACSPPGPAAAVGFSNSMYDARESKNILMMDVNVPTLLTCIQNAGTFKDSNGNPLTMADTTGGGLAFHFSFSPPGAAYGVRVENAKAIGTVNGTVPKGLTIATNEPMYVQGDYNNPVDTSKRVSASLLADSINVLSNSWSDLNKNTTTSVSDPKLKASNTTINAAFLAGIVPTSGAAYSGGLENYPRFHENWTGVTFTYSGSFANLGASRFGTASWSGSNPNIYTPPNRNWSFDTTFSNADKLPPLAPRFIYLRQLYFARNY